MEGLGELEKSNELIHNRTRDLLGYNSMYPVESEQTFRRNMSPASKKSSRSRWRALFCLLLASYWLLDLFSDPEEGGDVLP
jgi:hypothetical protein